MSIDMRTRLATINRNHALGFTDEHEYYHQICDFWTAVKLQKLL